MGLRCREGTVRDLEVDSGQGMPGVRRDEGGSRGAGRARHIQEGATNPPAALLLGKSGRKPLVRG